MTRSRDMASKTFWLPGETIQTVTMENLVQNTQSVGVNTINDLSNMSIVITPKKANSKILIHIRWSGEFSSTDMTWGTTFGCSRDGTQIGRPGGGANGTGIGIPSLSYYNNDASSTAESCIYFVTDTPGVTSAITYKATIASNIAATIYNNRTVNNVNTWGYESGSSAMTATEIAQ
jgi:hypothetical protein